MRTLSFVIILFSLNACSPLGDKSFTLEPDLLDASSISRNQEDLNLEEEKIVQYEKAHAYLIDVKEKIRNFNIEDKLERLNPPEAVKLKQRVIELRKTFNKATHAFEEMSDAKTFADGVNEFSQLKRHMEQQMSYLVFNYSV